MAKYDPADIIDAAESERARISEHYLPAAEWFLENPGLAPHTEAVEDLAAHLDVEPEMAGTIVGHLVSDDVDPVQQVVQPSEGKFVGVIDHAEHDWFYAFDRYDDLDGRETRAVCAHCVHEERSAADVAHFTRPPAEFDLETARAALGLHYQVAHEGRPLPAVLATDLGVEPATIAERHDLGAADALSIRDVIDLFGTDPDLSAALDDAQRGFDVPPVDVEPGASLVSGTTIAGNRAWHAGNDGSGSTLDADTLDGSHAGDLWRLVRRDVSGNARIATSTLGSDYHGYATTSTYATATLSPTRSMSLAFVDTYAWGYYGGGFTLTSVQRNGEPLSPTRTGILTTGITTNETFQFRWHAVSTVFSAFLYGLLQEPELRYPDR